MAVLIVAEHDNAVFTPDFFRVLTAARALECDIHLLIVGSECDAVTAFASDMLDVQKIILAKAPQLCDQNAEIYSWIVSELGENYSHILCSASNFGKALFPRVAAQLDIGMHNCVSQIHNRNTFSRSIFAGRVDCKFRVDERIKLLLINAASFIPAALRKDSDAAWPEISDYTFELPPNLRYAHIVDRYPADKNTVSLSNAEIVLGVGRGSVSAESDLLLINRLALALDAAVGATRAVVDAGWLPSDKQIGQTAKSVSPRLYIALGISGATQHLAGIKNSQTIVAVNRDPQAPIFDVADYALIADLKDVMPKLCGIFDTKAEHLQQVEPSVSEEENLLCHII